MKPYRKKRLDHYEILGEIFNTTTATGQMRFSSNQLPPNSDEERILEEIFLNIGVHVNANELVDESKPPLANSKGKKIRGKTNQSQLSEPQCWDQMGKGY